MGDNPDNLPPTGKYVITNQLYGKGMDPGEVAKYQGIHIDTLQKWCDDWGIQYPEDGVEKHIRSLAKSEIKLDYPEVDIPNYTAKWEKEDNSEDNSNDLDGALDW